MGGAEKQLTPNEQKEIEKQRTTNKIIEKTGYVSTEFAARAKALGAEDAAYKAGMERLFGTKISPEQWTAIKTGADKRRDDFRQSERDEIGKYKDSEKSKIMAKFLEDRKPFMNPETMLVKDHVEMKRLVDEKNAELSKLEDEVSARYANLRDVSYMLTRYCEFIAEEAIGQIGVAPDRTVTQLAAEIRKIRADASATYKDTFVVAKKTFDVAVSEK